MRLKVLSIHAVAESQLCCGCGACAYISPDEIAMVDVLDHGRRPWLKRGGTSPVPSDPRTAEALDACPGNELAHTFNRNAPGLLRELADDWGPVLEIWEGYAGDPLIRRAGSSGGAASALAVFCLELGGMHGVLHTAAREDVPYLNTTVLSKTREQVLSATGSRYAPASPCDGLQRVEDAPGPCVFIGKPCDVAGANKAAALRPGLRHKLGLTIGMFCAGTPSTRATLEMMKKMGVTELQDVTSVRYRGNGWPGMATVTMTDGRRAELTYDQSWGQILQKHRQWRCYVCADHTGEFADISVGDPWYREIPPNEPGRSLVVVRTERGREIVQRALASGHLVLERSTPAVLIASQPNLLKTRGSVWARMWVCRLLGAAAPRYRGLGTFHLWWRELGWKQKVQSVFGTAKRVFRKGLRRPIQYIPYEAATPKTLPTSSASQRSPGILGEPTASTEQPTPR